MDNSFDEFNNNTDIKLGIKKPSKEELIDQNFRKAEYKKDKNKRLVTPKDKRIKKTGLILIVFAILGILIINQLPWLYMKYDSEIAGGEIELFFDKDFSNEQNNKYYEEYDPLFESKNNNYPIGLSYNDFDNTYNAVFYELVAILVLGIFFTIISVFSWFKKYSEKNEIIIQTIFIFLAALFVIYIIYNFVKFFGAHLMLYHNNYQLPSNLSNLYVIFPTPFIMIMLFAVCLKIIFTIFKINFKELEKKYKSKNLKKSVYAFKRKADTK